MRTEEERRAFIRDHTALHRVPFVPEIAIHMATALTPLWQATQDFLDARSLEVPYWCTPWAGGQGLARFVLDHPETVRGKTVLDVGTGSGLVAMAAALAGAARVHALDVDALGCTAARMNVEASGLETVTIGHGDALAHDVREDVILAGDIWYEPRPAERFEAWLRGLDAAVFTGDPGRAYVPRRFVEVARYEVPTSADLESCSVRTTRILSP